MAGGWPATIPAIALEYSDDENSRVKFEFVPFELMAVDPPGSWCAIKQNHEVSVIAKRHLQYIPFVFDDPQFPITGVG